MAGGMCAPREPRLGARQIARFWLFFAAATWGLPAAVALSTACGNPHSRTATSPAEGGWEQCNEGPWGEVEYRWISLDLPESEIQRMDAALSQPAENTWYFTSFTTGQLRELFQGLTLTVSQRAALLDQAGWEISGGTIAVHPPPQTVIALSATDRKRIYEFLAQSEKNPAHFTPFLAARRRLDSWIDSGGLSTKTRDLIKQLTYDRDDIALFSDSNIVLGTIGDAEERVRFIRVMSSNPAVSARLRLRPDMDLRKLASYWSRVGAREDIQPILRSLLRGRDETTVDLVHLLPSFPRQRIYRYPTGALANSAGMPPDCFWSAANFFHDPPMVNPFKEGFTKHFRQYFRRVRSSPTYGDIAVWVTSDGYVNHAATYIADEIVFTKDGKDRRRPWLLSTIEDVSARYGNTVRFFRRMDGSNPSRRAAGRLQ